MLTRHRLVLAMHLIFDFDFFGFVTCSCFGLPLHTLDRA